MQVVPDLHEMQVPFILSWEINPKDSHSLIFWSIMETNGILTSDGERVLSDTMFFELQDKYMHNSIFADTIKLLKNYESVEFVRAYKGKETKWFFYSSTTYLNKFLENNDLKRFREILGDFLTLPNKNYQNFITITPFFLKKITLQLKSSNRFDDYILFKNLYRNLIGLESSKISELHIVF